MQYLMFLPYHQDHTALNSKVCSFSEVRDAGYVLFSTSPGQPLLLPFLPSNVPLLGIPQVPPLKMKQQYIARLWMPWVEDKTYHKGQQVDIPKAETGKLWRERRGCVLSLFFAICSWPLTMLLASGPLLWLQSLLLFLFSERYPGPENWSLNSCTGTAEDS